MTDTLYFTTDMPTESFDELSPDNSISEQRANSETVFPISKKHSHKPKTFLDPQEELECRIGLLEVAFQNHALELRDRVAARLEALEEKIEMRNGELHQSIREESKRREADYEDLAKSVANAIDRVESAAFAALKG